LVYKKILIVEPSSSWSNSQVHFFNLPNIGKFENSDFLKNGEYTCFSGFIISCEFTTQRKTHFIKNIYAGKQNKLSENDIKYIKSKISSQ